MSRARQRQLTIRLMIATALLMLTFLVGALATLGGDEVGAAWGKALLSLPIFLALFFFGHLVWKADLPRLWAELAKALERSSDKTLEQRQRREPGPVVIDSIFLDAEGDEEGGVTEGEGAVRSDAPTLQRSNASSAVRSDAPTLQRSNASSSASARPIIVNTHGTPERLQQLQGELAEVRRTHDALVQRLALTYQQLFTAPAPPALEALVAIEGVIQELTRTLQSTQAQAADLVADLRARQTSQEATIQSLRTAQATAEQQLAAAHTAQEAQQHTLQALREARDQALAREATLRTRLSFVQVTLALGEELPFTEAVRRFRTRVLALGQASREMAQARDHWRARAEAAEAALSTLRAATAPQVTRRTASARPQPRKRTATAGRGGSHKRRKHGKTG